MTVDDRAEPSKPTLDIILFFSRWLVIGINCHGNEITKAGVLKLFRTDHVILKFEHQRSARFGRPVKSLLAEAAGMQANCKMIWTVRNQGAGTLFFEVFNLYVMVVFLGSAVVC